MSSYSTTYKALSETLYSVNKTLIDAWAKDTSDPELSNACKMLIDAAEGGQK